MKVATLKSSSCLYTLDSVFVLIRSASCQHPSGRKVVNKRCDKGGERESLKAGLMSKYRAVNVKREKTCSETAKSFHTQNWKLVNMLRNCVIQQYLPYL